MSRRLDPNRPKVPEVAPLVAAYLAKDDNGAGGSLHILLSDYNVDDEDVDFCIQWAKDRGDADGVALGQTLRRMSKTQRLKLAARSGA